MTHAVSKPHPVDMNLDPVELKSLGEMDNDKPEYGARVGDASTWPFVQFLTVKRAAHDSLFDELGVILVERKTVVFLCGLFNSDLKDLSTCERIEYASVDAMKSDGWVID